MTSAPARDPLGGHLVTPGKRSAPAHRLPALAAGRGAQDGPQRLRVTLGERPAGGNTKPPRGTQQIQRKGW